MRDKFEKYIVEHHQEAEHWWDSDNDVDEGNIASMALQRAINEELVHEIAKSTLLDAGYRYFYVMADVPESWFKDNVKGEYRSFGFHYYFLNDSDAATFMLHWKQ